MDKEKEFDLVDPEVDFTGFSEAKSAQAVDKPVDLTAGQWVSVSGTPIFIKKPVLKKKVRK